MISNIAPQQELCWIGFGRRVERMMMYTIPSWKVLDKSVDYHDTTMYRNRVYVYRFPKLNL